MDAPHYDEQLWFIQDGCDEKHYLEGNPHTFHGRMAAWCPKQQRGLCVSKSEILECSTAARYWIQGFLSGNEPAYPTDDEGYPLEDDDPKVIKWSAALRLFAKTGVWREQEQTCEHCGEELLPSTPGLICERCLDEGIR